jgi:hypothetical protein
LDATWLFTRGTESVKITRTAEPSGGFRVLVAGPGATMTTHLCTSLADCMRLHQAIDAGLMAQGFQLSRATDRRTTPDRRRQPRGRGRRHP